MGAGFAGAHAGEFGAHAGLPSAHAGLPSTHAGLPSIRAGLPGIRAVLASMGAGQASTRAGQASRPTQGPAQGSVQGSVQGARKAGQPAQGLRTRPCARPARGSHKELAAAAAIQLNLQKVNWREVGRMQQLAQRPITSIVCIQHQSKR